MQINDSGAVKDPRSANGWAQGTKSVLNSDINYNV